MVTHTRKYEEVEESSNIDPSTILGINPNPKSLQPKKQRFNPHLYSPRNNQAEETNLQSAFDNVDNLEDQSAQHTKLNYKQRKAIRCMSTFNYTIEQTALEVGVSVSTINTWMKKQDFINVLFAQEKQLDIGAIQARLSVNNEIVNHLHEELLTRIHRGDLAGMSFKDIVSMLIQFAGESRLDDKHAVTQKIEENVSVSLNFDSMRERFNLHRIRREMYDDKVSKSRQLSPPQQQVTINAKLESK